MKSISATIQITNKNEKIQERVKMRKIRKDECTLHYLSSSISIIE
jgi:hypothetical protein